MWRHMVKTLWQGILTADEDSSEELVDDKHILFVKSFTDRWILPWWYKHSQVCFWTTPPCDHIEHTQGKQGTPASTQRGSHAGHRIRVDAKFTRRFSALKLPNWTFAQKHSLMRSLKSCWQVLLSSKKTLHEFSWPFKKQCQNIWQTSRGSWGSCLENLWTVSSMNEKEVCCLANLIP